MASLGNTRAFARGLLARRQVRTVLASAIAFAVIGGLYNAASADRITARVMITSSGTDEDAAGARPERRTADQARVLESPSLAARAADVSERLSPGSPLDAEDILARRTIVSDPLNSDLVVVEFEARDAEEAVLGAESIVTAYREWVVEVAAGSDAAIAELDAAIEEATARIAELEERRVRSASSAEASLASQRQTTIDAINATLAALAAASDPVTIDALTADLERSSRLLETLAALDESMPRTAESIVLDDEIRTTAEQIRELVERREGLRLAATLAASSVRTTSAEIDDVESRGGAATVAVFAGLGLVFGIGISIVGASRDG